MVNSMRIAISTLTLEGSAVEVLGGLAAFRPVPLVDKLVFCLLLLWGGESSVGDSGKMCVRYIQSVSGLNGSGGELASGGCFLDEEEIE